MSGIALAAPYLDTDADQLSFALGLPAHEALAVEESVIGGLGVQLRLLGASHQVFAGPVRETVACLAGAASGLPAAVVRRYDGWDYRFTARVQRYGAAEFGERVAGIRALVDGSAAAPADGSVALCGIFPGAPDALTALTARPYGTGVAWRTWHTYPQSHRIVATWTRLEAR